MGTLTKVRALVDFEDMEGDVKKDHELFVNDERVRALAAAERVTVCADQTTSPGEQKVESARFGSHTRSATDAE